MIARDASITMSLTETTYGQVVERAFTAERAEQLIDREHAARRESKRKAQAAAGSQRTGLQVIKNGRLQTQLVRCGTVNHRAIWICDRVGQIIGQITHFL